MFPSSSPFQSQVYSSLQQMRVWRFLTFKTKQKKTKRSPAPTPGRACGPFPRQNCSLWRASAFVAADRIQNLGAQPSRVLRSGVPSPKATGASGVRQKGFALPTPGPNRLPSRVQSQGARAQGWRECAPPGVAPAPPAGILGMSPVRKATGPPLGGGRNQTCNFSGALAQNSPSISAP